MSQCVAILQVVLTSFIGLIAVYIAWQQWRTNRNQFRLHFYDRRFAIYDAVALIAPTGNVTERNTTRLVLALAIRRLGINRATNITGAMTSNHMPDEPNAFRAASLQRLETLKAIDLWLSTASAARLAWVTVSLTLNLTATRGWTLAEVAEAIGVSEKTLARQKARFVKMTGLGSMY